MDQMIEVSLVILVVAGLGIATVYVVAGPTLRRILHGRGGRVAEKPSSA